GDATAGEALYKANCTSCHAMNKRVLGPALAGTNQRHDREWLQKWIKNAPAMVASGDAAAVKIYNEYNQAPMTPFPQFSEADIDNILAYIQVEGDKKPEAAAGAAAAGGESGDSSVSGYMIAGLIAVIVIALLVILVLNRVIGTLERLLLNKGDALIIEEDEEETEKKDQYAGLK